MFSPKELYMMNAGDKRYILTDGFADFYHATEVEEEIWKNELIANKIEVIGSTVNPVALQSAIDTLYFHHYSNVNELLLEEIGRSTVDKQIIMATALWVKANIRESFDLLCLHLRPDSVNDREEFFIAIDVFYNHSEARRFIVDCLQNSDRDVYLKALHVLNRWSETRITNLTRIVVDRLRQKEDNLFLFEQGLVDIKQLFGIDN